MKFVLNGKEKVYDGDPSVTLLKYLREHEGIISPKEGCSGQGSCGCCTIQLEDKAALSCTTPMKKVEGKSILTTEGMKKRVQDAFAKAFVEKGGIQCGFCTPGIVMRAKVLLDKSPIPTIAELKSELSKNICRCTGYKKIFDSVIYAAELIAGGEEITFETSPAKVGDRHPKYDCYSKVLGFEPFVCDITVKAMEHGALRFSDHPRAKVVSIDTTRAEALDGVTLVITHKNIPGRRVGGLIAQDWPMMIAEGETTRYIGDVIAGVVAKSEETAREAAKLIEIDYEVLEPVCDPFEAIKSSAPKIHAGGNILSKSATKRGDTEEAFKNSKFISEGDYNTQRVEHAFMEPECCLAAPGDPLVIYSQGQGVYEDRKQIAKILDLPEKKINVKQIANGGGFGGKEDLTTQGHAALLAHLCGVPVRVSLTREESLCMHPKRHPFFMKYKLGCDEKGRFTALKAEILGDTGAYASVGMKVVERGVGHATSAYHVDNIDVTGIAAYTNNIPCGAMRGFGVNQVAFAMEACIDDLCKQGGFDRWQIRYDNALDIGKMTATDQVMEEGVGVRQCLEALKDDFYNAKGAKGIATGIKNCGIGNGMPDIGRAKIVVEAEDKVVLHHGWTEMGQGAHTIAVQCLVNETGIDPKIIEVKNETKEDVVTGMTTSSRGTSLIGHAVIVASKDFRRDLKTKSLKELVGQSYHGEWMCDFTTEPGEKGVKKHITHYSYGYAAQLVILDDNGKIEKVVAAHDAGRIMNPTLFEGQIEGAIHMGLGYAIQEDFPLEKGRPVSTKLAKLKIIKAKDMPEVVIKGLEVKDPNGPFGAKGVGEIGLVPTAAAVACAIVDFDGKKRYSLPLNERKLLR